jgi:uncharacterized protein YjbJ (UPF0337 family)
MNEQVTGVANQGVGRVQDAVGGLTGHADLQAKGKIKEAVGTVQQAFGEAKGSVKDAFEDTLEGLQGQVQEQLDAVGPAPRPGGDGREMQARARADEAVPDRAAIGQAGIEKEQAAARIDQAPGDQQGEGDHRQAVAQGLEHDQRTQPNTT